MKKIFLSLMAITLATFLAAQAPQAINYQAIARDHAGNPITKATIGVQFRILQGEASGRLAYAETFSVATNQHGLFNLQIGRGTPVSGTFSGIDWAKPPCFLEVAIDPTGGNDYQVLGTSEMLSVPYALKAGNVEMEKQVLSLEGNRLSISQGNRVDLPMNACDVLEDCADPNGVDTKVRVYDPNDRDEIHMDLGKDPVDSDGKARIDVLVLRKNVNGNTMLELQDKPGGYNTFVGLSVGTANITNSNNGISNAAFGGGAFSRNTMGSYNTALGNESMAYNRNGIDNTAAGFQALLFNTKGSGNVAFGKRALLGGLPTSLSVTGDFNTAVGTESLYQNRGNHGSTAVGYRAMYNADNQEPSLGTRTYNTAVGYESLYGSTTPAANTGTSNTAMGDHALYANAAGNRNTAIGTGSLSTNTGGASNTATGANALFSNTTGDNNTATGDEALKNNIAGQSNTATGVWAMHENTYGSHNTAYGASALQKNLGNSNTAIGLDAMLNNVIGDYNTATGAKALESNISGFENTATGLQALILNTTGIQNTAVGTNALLYNVTGSSNTAVGTGAGPGGGLGNLMNTTAIGHNATVTTSNSMILGHNVNVGIGLSNLPGPANRLEINANANDASGLRFRRLTSNSLTSSTATKVLSVDAMGDVILVPTGGFFDCTNPAANLTFDSRINLVNGNNRYNFYFEGQDASKTNVGIGIPCGIGLSAKLDVNNTESSIGGRFIVSTSYPNGINESVHGFVTGAEVNIGGYFQANLGTETNGIRTQAHGATHNNTGGSLSAFGGGISNYGVRAVAVDAINNYAVHGLAANGSSQNWAGYFVGDVFTTGNYFPSDARLKKDRSPIEHSLDIIGQLNPQTYRFKTDEYPYLHLPEDKQYGLIIQEVETLLPETVTEVHHPEQRDEKGNEISPGLDFKAMNYNAFIPILIQAVKDQQLQIEGLKSQNAQLSAALAQQSQSLQTQLESLRVEMQSFRAALGQQPAASQSTEKK